MLSLSEMSLKTSASLALLGLIYEDNSLTFEVGLATSTIDFSLLFLQLIVTSFVALCSTTLVVSGHFAAESGVYLLLDWTVGAVLKGLVSSGFFLTGDFYLLVFSITDIQMDIFRFQI